MTSPIVLGFLIGFPSGVAAMLLWMLIKVNESGDTCECKCDKCGKPM